MVKYIIRPTEILSTPIILRRSFNAIRTIPLSHFERQNRKYFRPVYQRDFFLTYPHPDYISLPNGTTSSYEIAYNFRRGNKLQQRRTLFQMGLDTPITFNSLCEIGDTPVLLRPLRHRGGTGFTLDYKENITFNPEEEYLQEFYPKNHEYRLIIVKGSPIITLYKRNNEEIPPELPWNHSNGTTFITVDNIENNRLRHTNIFHIVNSNQQFFSSFDICALDIMLNTRISKSDYRVCEMNLAPSLTISDNIEKVVNHVKNSIQKDAL